MNPLVGQPGCFQGIGKKLVAAAGVKTRSFHTAELSSELTIDFGSPVRDDSRALL